jgi:hypothetical protein
MKKAFPWILLVVVIFLWFGDRSGLKNDLAKIEKASLEQKAVSETTIALKDKEIAEKEDRIAEINGLNDSLNTIIAKLEGDVQDALGDVAEARKGWEAFSLECQVKLNELDSSWSATFSLQVAEIAKLKEQVRLADDRDLLRQGEILDLKSIISEKDKIISGCEAAQKDIVRACLKDKQKANLKGNLKTSLGFVAGFIFGKV